MMRREDAMDTNTTLGFEAQKQWLVLDSKGGESDGAHAADVVEASSGDKRSSIFGSNGVTELQRGNEAVWRLDSEPDNLDPDCQIARFISRASSEHEMGMAI